MSFADYNVLLSTSIEGNQFELNFVRWVKVNLVRTRTGEVVVQFCLLLIFGLQNETSICFYQSELSLSLPNVIICKHLGLPSM